MTAGATPRIVVGIDGSEPAAAALEWALDEARLRAATVVAVHAWQYPYVNVTGFPAPELDLTDFAQSARRILDTALLQQDCAGVDVVRLTPMAAPATALLELAQDAGLLVVGSRGRGGFSGLLLGSVSQQCVHHARCPIVIVPPPGRATQPSETPGR